MLVVRGGAVLRRRWFSGLGSRGCPQTGVKAASHLGVLPPSWAEPFPSSFATPLSPVVVDGLSG